MHLNINFPIEVEFFSIQAQPRCIALQAHATTPTPTEPYYLFKIIDYAFWLYAPHLQKPIYSQ